ncbi:hypothetical protein KGY14_03860 [Ameyamaea chiangmaiensis]|uniref:Uncharacterized protein n=1 Tax=Ameyamaea chiangmaiensis TaxID=442969 RepID=A0A850PFN0_9PROT|nr:hypothetical protein [Ameyamaea chiangmaiensis]MBS4074325.1 hypothetical protein [Ameyamaea chiangmaiensis]NVN41046.1 hypothetical protein [Ameyamaea chiangmaiensis]
MSPRSDTASRPAPAPRAQHARQPDVIKRIHDDYRRKLRAFAERRGARRAQAARTA